MKAYSIASFIRTGTLDDTSYRAIRKYLWLWRMNKSQVSLATAVTLLIRLNFHPLLAHEICVQFNRQCNERKPLSQAIAS